MEYLPGIAGRTLGELSPDLEVQISQDVIALLKSLQAVRNPEGCGPLDGPFYKKWWDYHRQRVEAVYAFLRHDPNRSAFDKTVLEMVERSLERGEEIFSDRDDVATLIHGDYSLGNIMFDPTTYQITGLIDPLEAEWGDPVLDAIHLTKSHGDRFRLVERYREVIGGSDRFPLHFWFYQFWTWLYYYALIDIDVKGWLNYCAQELQRAMEEYL